MIAITRRINVYAVQRLPAVNSLVVMILRKYFSKRSAQDCRDHLNHAIQLYVLSGNCVQESYLASSWDCPCFGVLITPGMWARPHIAGHFRGHAFCEHQREGWKQPFLIERAFRISVSV